MTEPDNTEEKEMSVPNAVWAEAPKEATHYSPETLYTNAVYWLIEDGIVKSVWIAHDEYLNERGWYEDQGYICTDYTPDEQPYFSKGELVTRPTKKWIPRVGDTVLYKRTDSLESAWDTPVEVHVLAVHSHLVWIKGEWWDIVVDMGDLQPKPTVKTLESRLNEIINPEGRAVQHVSTTIRRLIEAGVVFKD